MAEISATDTGVGSRSLLRSPLRLLASREPWLAFAFMVLSFVLGLFWFIVLVTFLSVGFGLAITLVGLPLLMGTLFLWIQGARLERLRVRWLLGARISDPYLPPPQEATWWARLKTRLQDRYVWLDLLYLFLLFPIGIAEFVIAIFTVSFPVSTVLMPAYYWIGDGPDFFTMRVDTLPEAIGVSIIGLPLLLVMPYVLIGVGRGHAWLAKHLLGTDREAELTARVGELTVSRSRALDSAVVDLRRIERDLHDGAQQRLVKLSMDLGLAREMMESDPESARRLIDEAHDESKRAMQEIRDLARGIHPAVLADRGLSAAVSALAARSTVPVELNITLDERLPEPVETAAYFIVAETLTNVARHSQATSASVTIRRSDDLLLVDVEDDGVGGASIDRGSGLAGIRDRAAALEGHVVVESLPGKGTLVHVELPCGS